MVTIAKELDNYTLEDIEQKLILVPEEASKAEGKLSFLLEDIAFSLGLRVNGFLVFPKPKYFQRFGISANGLKKIALSNMKDEATPFFKSVEDILKERFGAVFSSEDSMVPLYCLGYTKNREPVSYGAIALLSEDLLKSVADKFGEDFFIIPSSKHEILIIPASKLPGLPEELLEIVKTVNITEVEPTDKLTDSVYKYDTFLECIIKVNNP